MALKIPPPLVALILAISMWTLASLGFGMVQIPGFFVVATLTLGLSIDLLALIAFFQLKTTINPMKPTSTSKLAIIGIYQYTRNPMYVGLCIVLFSWVLWLGCLYNLIGLPVFVWYITKFQIIPEEKVLEALFSQDYPQYKADVRRWI